MRKIAVVVVLVAVLAAGGWFAAARLQSPDQVAAQAAPPPPEPVVVPAEVGFLQGTVTLAVTAEAEQVHDVQAPEALAGVVSAQVATPGTEVRPGAVLLRVDGEPVFVLPGAFPLYRDIAPDAEGDDVLELQKGLTAAGLYSGSVDGVYGPGTQAAVARMYREARYDVPRAPVEAVDEESSTLVPPSGATAPAVGTPVEPSDVAEPRQGGPIVLRTQVVLVGALPAVLRSLPAVGARLGPEAPLASLSSGGTVLATTLPTSSAEVLSTGATAVFTGDDGAEAHAVVDSLTADASTGESRVVLRVTGGTVSAGTGYTLRLDNPANEPRAGLLVPATSVVARGGRSFVYVEVAGGYAETEVRVDGQQGGVVAVTPLGTQTALVDGADVRVGVDDH